MLFNRIYRRLFPKTYSLEEYSQKIIEDLRKDGASIGENVDILSSDIEGGGIASLLKIGNNVTITGARILLHDASTYKALGYTKVGEVTIGNDVFIGVGSIILPFTHIGSRVIIGAGTVVAKDIPDNSVVIGSPCQVIGTYDAYMDRQKDMMSRSVCLDVTLSDLLLEENADKRKTIVEAKRGFSK